MKKRKTFASARLLTVLLLLCTLFAMTVLLGACGDSEKEDDTQEVDERTDEEIVQDALKNTFSQSSAVTAALAENFSNLEFSDATETTVRLALTDAGSFTELQDFEGAEITLDVQSDQVSGENYIGAAFELGSLAVNAEVYASEEELSVGSVLLGDTVLTLDLTEDLQAQMESSPLFSDYAEYLEAYSYGDMSDLLSENMDFLTEFEEYMNAFTSTDAYAAFENSMTVTRGEGVECTYDEATVAATDFEIEVSYADAVQLLCDYVDYIFANEDFVDYMDQMISAGYTSSVSDDGSYTSASDLVAEWESAKEDLLAADADGSAVISICVYNDMVLSLDTDMELTVEEETATVSVSWDDYGKSGESARKTVLSVEMAADEENLGLEVTNLEKSEGMTRSQSTEMILTENGTEMELDMDISYDTEEYAFEMDIELSAEEIGVMELSAYGTVMGLSDELYIFLDDVTYAYDGDSISFSLYFDMLDLYDGVTTLEGTKIDVLEADEDDLTLLYLEIMDAVSGLNGLDDFLALLGYDIDDLLGTGYSDSDYDYDDDYYSDDYAPETYGGTLTIRADMDDYYSDDYVPETYDEFIAYVKEMLGEDYYEEYLIESLGEDYETILKYYYGES